MTLRDTAEDENGVGGNACNSYRNPQASRSATLLFEERVMLIGYVSDERYVALPDVLLEFEPVSASAGSESVEARSRASGVSTPIPADICARC